MSATKVRPRYPPAPTSLPAEDPSEVARQEHASRMERHFEEAKRAKTWRNRLALAWLAAVGVGLITLQTQGMEKLLPDLLSLAAAIVLFVTTILVPLLTLVQTIQLHKWRKLLRKGQKAGYF